MDSKLSMIGRFIPQIQFQYVDILVSNFQQIVNESQTPHGIFVNNINPFLVAISILEISNKIKYYYPLSKLRIQQFEGDLNDSIIKLLNGVYDPHKIRLLLKQQDLQNHSSLDLMAKLRMF